MFASPGSKEGRKRRKTAFSLLAGDEGKKGQTNKVTGHSFLIDESTSREKGKSESQTGQIGKRGERNNGRNERE